ncbi:hypothetical protein EYF80_016282 [Liparis tanakae]|uniref:Uncharacterized protein n=1 Tax=Liparis tanakae TaxID=230148 RepID=A0A4Z2I836_9TELE|nr:hypothetical protein EYF80_016282 [Liparis tanakae]
MPRTAMRTGITAHGELHSSLTMGMGSQPVLLAFGRKSKRHILQVNVSAWYWASSPKGIKIDPVLVIIASKDTAALHLQAVTPVSRRRTEDRMVTAPSAISSWFRIGVILEPQLSEPTQMKWPV